ncbi:MAG: tetratricopeptide repeat protein [Gammaproteobacteria bacterium]
MTRLLTELKRRHVVRAAIVYAAAVWAVAQGIVQLSPTFGLPALTARWFVIACAIGFPFWIAFAWYFRFTARGIEREPETAPAEALTRREGRKLDYWIIGILAVAVVLLLTNLFVTHHDVTINGITMAPSATNVIPEKSIAVLPFENLSADKGNAYFASGMQDLILTKLADIGDLKVISRTSTLSYGSHPENLKTIGQQLGVATLLEGSVQKSGNVVLINVQLIDARTDNHIWAQSYQRTLDNVFGVEGEVAEQIATALKARLSPAETQRLATALSSDPAANDLFLRAEYFTNQGQINYATAPWKQAITLYRQAIAKVPDFALARARLSYVESDLAWFGGGGEDVQQLTTDARSQAEQALALQPDLAEAHLAIGYSDYWGRGNYAGALTAFAAALRLRPNDSNALAATGYVLRRDGRFNAAIAALRQALARDPRNSGLAFELGNTYQMVSRYPDAEAAFQHALALDPDNLNAKSNYSQAILLASGDVARALAAAQGDDTSLQEWRVTLLTYQRKYREALALLAGIPDTPDNFSFLGGSKAQLQADLYRLSGDGARARALHAQALPLGRVQVKAQAGSATNESEAWGNVADAELGLGHTAAGLAAIDQSQALLTRTHDYVYDPAVMQFNAGLYAEAARPDLAVPLLEKALASPGIGFNYSPVMLWLDPAWDPIRNDPHFQALLQKYAQYRPAGTVATAPAAATSATP